MPRTHRTISANSIEESIRLLKQYVGGGEIAPLLEVLEALKLSPQDEALVERLFESFHALGITQGAVLTYAPYIGLVMSDDPFEDTF